MENQLTENEVLYGKDKETNIVGAHQASSTHVRLYTRNEGEVTYRDEPFYPFFFLEEKELLNGYKPEESDMFWMQNLSGNNSYKYLAIFKNYKDYRRAIDFIGQENKEGIYDKGDSINQYFYQTGKTLFKGMDMSKLRRMQLDIETYYRPTVDTKKDKSIGSDPIIIVALSDNTGWEKVLHATNKTEKQLLLELVATINERDPDVIEGHNIYAFDLPYIQKRCDLNNVSFAIGRDGSTPRSFQTSIRFAERTLDYPCFDIAGRHVVDTFFLIQFFDVAKRTLPSYGLKQVAKYFGFAAENRTYVDYKDMADAWDNDRERLLSYALDDVRETAKLSDMLSGSYFYLTQMLPFTFGQVARTGPAAKIEALFVRNYLKEKRSLPKPQIGEQGMGGLTRVYLKGILGPIVYADVESLYPSIMLSFDVCPKSDEAKLFPTLLSNLKDMRFFAKDKMKEERKLGNQKEADAYDAMQNSYKTLINSMYGYLGFRHGIFNDYEQADKVTSTGQNIAKKMMKEFEGRGAKVVEIDTDGIFLIPPENVDTEEKEVALVREVSNEMPTGIQIGYDGRFKKMISYKKKNYVLLDYNDKMKIKGSSLVSRSSEKFGREFIREGFKKLLEEDVEGLRNLYLYYREKIMSKSLLIDEFSKTETLKKTMKEYDDHVREKKGKSGVYELVKRSNMNVTKGDRVSYYIAGTAVMASSEMAKLASEWKPDRQDMNVEFYLRRLNDFTEKFKDFFSPNDFSMLFSVDELFPVEISNITLIKEIQEGGNEEEYEESEMPF